jgi:hypothetical protein
MICKPILLFFVIADPDIRNGSVIYYHRRTDERAQRWKCKYGPSTCTTGDLLYNCDEEMCSSRYPYPTERLWTYME